MNGFVHDGSPGACRRREGGIAQRFAVAAQWVMGLSMAVACQCALGQAVYRIEPLGWLDGCTTYAAVAAGLSESGQVTGSACTPSSSRHAFLWKNDGTPMMDLGPSQAGSFSQAFALNASAMVIGVSSVAGNYGFATSAGGTSMTAINDSLGGSTAFPTAINDTGQVTGSADTGTTGHAFVWKNNGTPMIDLGALGPGESSNGLAINMAGQVTGLGQVPGADHAFVWKNNGSPMQDLGTLGGQFSQGLFINASGQVAGNSDAVVNRKLQTHAFLWRNDGTAMQDLGTLGGTYSSPSALNDAGQVAGNSYTSTVGRKNPHAFVWLNDGTPMKDLGTLGGNNSRANDMNSAGQVTGNAQLANAVRHAFLWRNDGTKLQDLNSLIDATDPLKPYVTLSNGDFINNHGDVVADGTDSRSGKQGLYLLHGTPLTLAPRSLAFGNHPIHTVSAAKSVTMTNTSANAVAVTSIALTGSAAGQFASTDNCGASLAGHAACTIKVTFKPTTKGAKSAFLKVNGGAGGLLSVPLAGRGT